MSKQKKVKIGIVGCGNISGIYFTICRNMQILDVAACADLDMERARARAAEFSIPKACTVDELLADPEIAIVVNLTVPKAHYQVARKAIEAGKSVYNEKPLSVRRDEGAQLLELAHKQGVLIGGAPDTFLGAGHQTCRKLIDDGAIGEPVAATAFMMCHGHESWHPSPEFYYEQGGGPMLDMGPYYITALVNMIGPVRRVTASARITFPTRTITSEPKKGNVVKVETPTHIAGVMDFANGAVGTIITSFDIWSHTMPRIEVYGTEGSLRVPDPNGFGGEVFIRKPGDEDWTAVPHTHPYPENSRGLGVADMAHAIRSKGQARAGGELTLHVLDVMQAFNEASDLSRHITLETTCEKPAPLPVEAGKWVK